MMRENPSERSCDHKEHSFATGITSDGGGGGGSKEEDDILGKNIKKMSSEVDSQGKDNETLMKTGLSDVQMEDSNDTNALGSHEKLHFQKQSMKDTVKNKISYKAKLVGTEEEALNRSFEQQMAEWLKEEEETAPIVTEEQRSLLGTIPSLHISNDKLMELCKPWKDALILTVLGRKTNLHMMRDRVKWLLRSDKFDLIDLPNNYFIFKTSEPHLRARLLFDGPWLIQGHYLAVQRWSPNFNPHCNKVRKVAVWIRIPTLPVHMYSEECMYEIGNLIGKTLKVDMNTLAHQGNNRNMVERGKYARVSIEVDLNKKLQSRFLLRNHVYTIEYEGLNEICFNCGIYGHTADKCSSLNGKPALNTQKGLPESLPAMDSTVGNEEKRPLMSVPGVSVEQEYGPWMQVKSRVRSKPQVADSVRISSSKPTPSIRMEGKQPMKGGGSRFSLLQITEPEIKSKDLKSSNKEKEGEMKWRRKDKQLQSDSDAVSLRRNKLENRGPFFEEGEPSFVKDNQNGARRSGASDDTTLNKAALAINVKSKVGSTQTTETETTMNDANMPQPKGNLPRDSSLSEGETKANGPAVQDTPLGRENSKKKQKKGITTNRTRVVVPNFKRKQQRSHSIVFGSALNNESPKWDQLIPPVKDQEQIKYTEVERDFPTQQMTNSECTRPPEPNISEDHNGVHILSEEVFEEAIDANLDEVEAMELVDPNL